jgi:hypothetical protein
VDAAQRRKRDGVLQAADQSGGRAGQPGRDLTGALIVTAELGAEDFAFLDAQRRRFFPADRNHLGAHLTMFHALPPSSERELARFLAGLANRTAPDATLGGLMNLGRGVAYRVLSADLESIRDVIADRFHGMMTAQDSGGWRPHVTIQNKVEPANARATLAQLEKGFTPRPLSIGGLGLHRYAGGPWDSVGRWAFRS